MVDREQLLAELIARGLTVGTAESLTGGDLAAALTAVPGASAAYVGGVVSYATSLKQQLLGVTPDLVRRHGVVSAQCAEQMATGARELLGADLVLSTTGVAGPDLQEGKPAGLAYVGLASPHGVTVREVHATGTRAQVRAAVVEAAVEMIAAELRAGSARAVGEGE